LGIGKTARVCRLLGSGHYRLDYCRYGMADDGLRKAALALRGQCAILTASYSFI
jgi:hypothetical protein